MHSTLIEFCGLHINGWKIIGYAGVLMFSARWFVQLWASRVAKKPVVPVAFWVMSMIGSFACLSYFVFGKNDSVGVLGNLFPCGVAAYNLYLEITHRRHSQKDAGLQLSNERAAANRHPAGQADALDNLSAIVPADRTFPAAVAERDRSVKQTT